MALELQPAIPNYLLRLPEVELAARLSRSTIYRMVQAGTFPKPVKIGKRASAWRESDVLAWIESRTSEYQ